MKKALLIIGGIVLVGGIGYFLYNRFQAGKTETASTTGDKKAPVAPKKASGTTASSTGRPDMSGLKFTLTPQQEQADKDAKMATSGRG